MCTVNQSSIMTAHIVLYKSIIIIQISIINQISITRTTEYYIESKVYLLLLACHNTRLCQYMESKPTESTKFLLQLIYQTDGDFC